MKKLNIKFGKWLIEKGARILHRPVIVTDSGTVVIPVKGDTVQFPGGECAWESSDDESGKIKITVTGPAGGGGRLIRGSGHDDENF